MDGLKLKYDIEYDSWVLEPIHVTNYTTHGTDPVSDSDRRHSSASTERRSCSSATPLRRSHSFPHRRWSPSPSHHDDNGRFWRSLKRYWTCLNPQTDNTHHHCEHHDHPGEKEKQKIECCCSNALAKTSNLTTYYTAMSSEERDEHIKAVVLYCKSTSS